MTYKIKSLIFSLGFHVLVLILLGAFSLKLEALPRDEVIYDVALISSTPVTASPAVMEQAVCEVPPRPDDIIEEKKPLPKKDPKTPKVNHNNPAPNSNNRSNIPVQGANVADNNTSNVGNVPAIPPESDNILVPAVPPQVLTAKAPEYPSSARSSGIEGRVEVRFLIGKTGEVEAIDINSSSGSKSLDNAALKAAKGYRFGAGFDEYGRPVRCYAYRTFNFKLQ